MLKEDPQRGQKQAWNAWNRQILSFALFYQISERVKEEFSLFEPACINPSLVSLTAKMCLWINNNRTVLHTAPRPSNRRYFSLAASKRMLDSPWLAKNVSWSSGEKLSAQKEQTTERTLCRLWYVCHVAARRNTIVTQIKLWRVHLSPIWRHPVFRRFGASLFFLSFLPASHCNAGKAMVL